MEIILLERIEKLGQMGDVVRVKPGFARNFLLPQKKALRANKANMAYFETQRGHLEADNLKRRDEAEAAAKKLEGLMVALIRQAGDSGQLYGSVTARDLADAIAEQGATVQRRQIELEKPIKVLGLHTIKVRLHPEVTVDVVSNVARSPAEAESQAQSGRVVSVEEQRDAEEAEIEAVIATVEETEEAEESEESTDAENESGTDAEDGEQQPT
jgi:large subunit ribosomal protein L9